MESLAKGILHSPFYLVFVTLGIWVGFYMRGDFVEITRATYFLLGVTLLTLTVAYLVGRYIKYYD